MEYFLLLTLSLLTTCGSQKTRYGGNYTPMVGRVIADFAGNVNYTFTCGQFCDDGRGNIDQITTTWTLENFLNLGLVSVDEEDHPEFTISGTQRNGSIPFPTFRDELTIVNLTRRLHNVRLYCGHSLNTTDGYWELRVYSGPELTSTHVAVVEGEAVSVDLSAGHIQAFPFPREFEWRRNGVTLINSSRMEFGYPQLNITSVTREDSGLYTLTATNTRLSDPQEVVGTDNGSIQLQVYYGPEVESAGLSFIGAEDDNVTIVCGHQLRGDPTAIMEWRDSEGNLLDAANSTFLFSSGPEVVSLMILGAKLTDSGNWTCTLTNAQTGTILERVLALTIISRPPVPVNVTVESAGASWLYIRWSSLLNISTNFTVRATPSSGGGSASSVTVGRKLQTNLTGLAPGQEYIVTVTATNSLEGVTATSGRSYPVVTATNTSVPEPICLRALSFNGFVNLSWEYIHTGGLNLTALTVDYVTHELAEFQNVRNDLSDSDRTTLQVDSLAAGESYTFRITASNERGEAQAYCPELWHSTGIPQTPVIHRAISNSPLEVVLTVSTRASGTQPQDSSFQFIVRVRDNSTLLLQMGVPYPDYQDGSAVALKVSSGLRGGTRLSFEVEAQNQYGSSPVSTAVQVTVREATSTEHIPVAVVVGSAVGGAAVLVLVVMVIVVTLCACALTSQKRSPGRLEPSNSLEMVANTNYGKISSNFADRSDELQPYEAIPVNLGPLSSQGNNKLAPRTEKTSDNPLYSSTGELRMSALFNAYDVLPPTRSRGHSPAFNGRHQSTAPSPPPLPPPSTHTSITQHPLPSRPRSETLLHNNSHLYAFPRHEHSPSHPTPNECGPTHSTTETDSPPLHDGNLGNRDHMYAVARDPTVNTTQEPMYFEL